MVKPVQHLRNHVLSQASDVSRVWDDTLRLVTNGRHTGSTVDSSTAFVTFRSLTDWVVATQGRLSVSEDWRVTAAPEPWGVVWRNADTPERLSFFLGSVAFVLNVLGLIFWSFPVSLIMTFVSINNMERMLPLLRSLATQWPTQYALLTENVPVWVLMGLVNVLPMLFQSQAVGLKRLKSKAEIQRFVLKHYIAYLLATLYVCVVSGSSAIFLPTLMKIEEHPRQLTEILGQELPIQANFFVQFVTVRLCVLPVRLLQIPYVLKSFRGQEVPRHCDFAHFAGDAAMVLVLGLTYAVINPFALPVCVMYFSLASIVYRWLFNCAYTSEFDGSGRLWYNLSSAAMLGLFIGTLALWGLASSFCGVGSGQSYFAGFLPLIVALFYFYCKTALLKPSEEVSLEEALAADRTERGPSGGVVASFTSTFYLDPALATAEATTLSRGQAGQPPSPATTLDSRDEVSPGSIELQILKEPLRTDGH